MWSICFAIDRVASMSTPRLLTWLLKEILWLPTLKWLSCDTLTLLRDPTTRASVLSLFSFSLLTVIQLPTESTHCSTSWTSEGKSDGADGLWSWVSSANLWWLYFLWELTSDSAWVYKVKSTGPKTKPWRTPFRCARDRRTIRRGWRKSETFRERSPDRTRFKWNKSCQNSLLFSRNQSLMNTKTKRTAHYPKVFTLNRADGFVG